MASPRSKRNARPEVPVVRREPAERRRLSPELEAFARSEDTRLPRKTRPTEPRLRDPRTTGLVPGVANRDARAVCDARVTELERLLEKRTAGENVDAELGRCLAEAVATAVWRGRSVTGFEPFAVHVLRMTEDDATALAEAGRAALGWPEGRASEALVAIWFRTEAALREAGFPGRGSRRIDDKGREHFVLDLELRHAPESLEAIARRMTPLVRDKLGGFTP